MPRKLPNSEGGPIAVAIIGVGEHMIRAHIPYLLENESVRITHYFDTNSSLDKAAFGTHHPVQVESVQEIYKNPAITAVFIGSPDRFHIEQLKGCLENGKHVFCEKPIGISSNDIEELKMLLVIHGDQLVISTCHPRRFDPPITWLKNKLSEKDWVTKNLGDIIGFSFDFWYHEVVEGWKKDRSLLLDHFGHEIDLMRFLFDSQAVQDVGAQKHHDAYDFYHVTGHVKEIAFSFRGFRKDPKEVYHEAIRLDGTRGSITINLNKGIVFYTTTTNIEAIPGIDYEYRFKRVTDDFIEAVLHGKKPYVTLNDILINNRVGVLVKEKGTTHPG